MSEYFQNIQQIAGKYNFRIVKAVVDRSGGEEPFLTEVFSLIAFKYAEAYLKRWPDKSGATKGFLENICK